ncbi:hypothetical protein EDD11_010535 [Mortierella claussenii]|nr:hypothetical protein EDD11_010535 [Mortierella claussenii]
MLWRQRTLTSYDDLIEFYQAIDFSASLRKRQQKQRQDQQQQRLGMGYAVEEGLFTNEAALRIKSLTLLDMSLGSTFLPSLPSLSVSSTDSNQFFGGRTRSHSHADPLVGAGATLDFCQGIDLIPKHSTIDENSMIESFSKETTPASSSMTSSSSFSSTASPSSSAGPSTASFTTSKRRPRQKTTSIYSEMISPRLLNTIASHCFALVDLTICMDSNKSLAISGPSAAPSSPRTMVQPSIPFSIIAGALLSLKRLTLMGLICDSSQNKTGSELLVFAQKIHPLERISIRSCKGISLETYVELAVRSNRSLLSVDFEGLDFESSQQLTDMMSAYARYCKSLKSITLSCLHGLALDGVIMALAQHRATELQELHVLGHDSFQIPQQQQQHHHQGAPAPLVQQEPANNNNNNDHHNNINNVHVNQDGVQVPVTQMCHLADANIAFSNLALLHLRRLTLYCPGITDFALFQYLCNSPQLADLVLHEPTTILQHPQFQPFVQPYLAQSVPQEETGPIVATGLPQEQEDNSFGPPTQSLSLTQTPPTMASMTSAGFLELIFRHCPWLKYLFMKLSLETAQEWIVQPCFKQAGLDRCLYQYRTATGAPAVVMMWDARNKVVSRAST